MSKKKKIVIISIIVTLLVLAGVLVYLMLFTSPKVEKQTIKKVDSIKGFDYHLEDRDTKLYKDEFQILKKNLESDEIDYEEYASSIAKLFIIDLYTIDNKVNKYDVGSLEFVYPKSKENFELNVKDTLYKYIEDNSYDDRTQELPIVSAITVDDIKESTYKLEEEEIPSYEVTLSWEYEEDLDYDDEAIIKIIKDDKTLYVVEKTDTDASEIDE